MFVWSPDAQDDTKILSAGALEHFEWPLPATRTPDFVLAPLHFTVTVESSLPLAQCHHVLVFGRLISCNVRGTHRLSDVTAAPFVVAYS